MAGGALAQQALSWPMAARNQQPECGLRACHICAPCMPSVAAVIGGTQALDGWGMVCTCCCPPWLATCPFIPGPSLPHPVLPQVLHVHSARIGATPGTDTLVLVRGAQRAWFQLGDYLFLSPRGYQRFG